MACGPEGGGGGGGRSVSERERERGGIVSEDRGMTRWMTVDK